MADPSITFISSWLTPSSLFILLNIVIGTIAITSRFTTTSSAKPHHHDPADPPQPQLHRSPSLLERVRSFKLSEFYNTHHDSEPIAQPESGESTQPQLVRSPSLLERVRSFKLSHYYNTTHYDSEPSESTQPQLVGAPSLLERVTSFNLGARKYEPTESETHHLPAEAEDTRPNQEKQELVRSPSLLQRLRSMSFSRVYRSEEEEDPDPNPGKWEEEGTVEKRRPATARETTSYGVGDDEVDAKADDFINRFKKQLRLQRVDSILRYRRGNS